MRRVGRRACDRTLLGALAACVVVTLGAATLPGVHGAAHANRPRYRGPGARVIPRRSRSVGYPDAGRLQRGVQAVPNPYLRYTGEYAPAGRFFGTWEMVQLLERAAYRVWRRAPGAKLSIGELSEQAGGDVPGHGSHENGRDADIAFYMVDGRGQPVEPWAFAAFDEQGRGQAPNEAYRFDDRRNFELVAKLVTDGDARVQYIFVSNPIRRRLLRWGRAHGAPSIILDRLEATLVQPATGHPHHNHFHVRIYCAPADRPSCLDRGPFHGWYPGTPPSAARVAAGKPF